VLCIQQWHFHTGSIIPWKWRIAIRMCLWVYFTRPSAGYCPTHYSTAYLAMKLTNWNCTPEEMKSTSSWGSTRVYCIHIFYLKCIKSYPCTGVDRTFGFQEVEAPRISTQSAQECCKSVSPTHRPPLPPGDIPGTQFCYKLSRPQDHSVARRTVNEESQWTHRRSNPRLSGL
jgi:hypothetical protein